MTQLEILLLIADAIPLVASRVLVDVITDDMIDAPDACLIRCPLFLPARDQTAYIENAKLLIKT